jgi:rSAM/selenodomain-associated transferase 2/rSAM/selenodomain-associated transferase 1
VATAVARQRREALAILAKHPTPGLAKTRLIPALGPVGAAALHERMVRRTLAEVDRLRVERAVDAQVRVAGAAPAEFASRFDASLPCVPQCEGDLGARLREATADLLASARAAVVIGTDCPELSSGLLHAAFDALRSHDVVLGPALDGGYYLIGLSRPAPTLFEEIAWSSEVVLAQTLAKAEAAGLSVHRLPALADVDEPRDLALWEAVVRDACADDAPTLSIVIPTLGEARRIGGLVESLRRPGVEVVVADGGSADGTRAAARAAGARVLLARPGRGPQLNEGAAIARGQRLLFLHADTELPRGFPEIVERTLADPAVALGAFRFALDRSALRHRCIEWGVRLRCAWARTPYGDQALFLRRATFDALGGFAPMPLLEDLDLVRRAKRLGRIVVAAEPAVTSARRWDRNGVVRTTAVNRLCAAAFLLGVAPERVAAWRSRRSDAGLRTQIDSVGSAAPSARRAASIARSDEAARK